jgi:hypothetical protein
MMIGQLMNVKQLVECELAGEAKVVEKTSPSATLATTNPIWPDLVLSPGRRSCDRLN